MTTCLHCRTRKVAPRKRGLCFSCYQVPDVRHRYPFQLCPHSRRGVGNGNHRRFPPTPTSVPPGPDKVEVLAQRAAAGLDLWSPLDATFVDTDSPNLTTFRRPTTTFSGVLASSVSRMTGGRRPTD